MTYPREMAALLARAAEGAVFDEVQRVPELLSWVQDAVDSDRVAVPRRVGRGAPARPRRLFVLTGSHSFELMGAVAQSLAGRTAVLHLLPMSIAELRTAGLRTPTDRLIHAGGYPRVHADRLPPAAAMADFFATCVERDKSRRETPAPTAVAGAFPARRMNSYADLPRLRRLHV